jgi:hypothetical protein
MHFLYKVGVRITPSVFIAGWCQSLTQKSAAGPPTQISTAADSLARNKLLPDPYTNLLSFLVPLYWLTCVLTCSPTNWLEFGVRNLGLTMNLLIWLLFAGMLTVNAHNGLSRFYSDPIKMMINKSPAHLRSRSFRQIKEEEQPVLTISAINPQEQIWKRRRATPIRITPFLYSDWDQHFIDNKLISQIKIQIERFIHLFAGQSSQFFEELNLLEC